VAELIFVMILCKHIVAAMFKHPVSVSEEETDWQVQTAKSVIQFEGMLSEQKMVKAIE